MNELPETTDLEKLYDAVQCIKKTVRCTVCLKLPTETNAGKCGHPFCKNCGDKILNTKKAVCTICKTVIIRSAVHSVQSIDKIVKDLSFLCEAIEKDSDTIFRLDRPQNVKQYQGKWKTLTLPGPSNSKTGQEDEPSSEFSEDKSNKQSKRGRPRGKKVDRKGSTGSEETIKIHSKIQAKKKEPVSAAVPSTSKATDVIPEPVFTTDNLSVKIGTIGYKEKVEGWLYSEEFENEKETEPGIAESPLTSDSPTISGILESFSQMKQNPGESTKSGRNSRASKTPKKNERSQDSMSTEDDGRKFKSFTFAARDKMRQTIPKNDSMGAKMFAELQKKTLEEQADNKKSRGPSVSTDGSWSELARLKKEAGSKVRKRRRLNVSIERPNITKPVLEPFDHDDSDEKKELKDINSVEDGRNESKETNDSAKKRQMPALVSYRTLQPSEMINIQSLNRQQVEDIIGVLDVSKNYSPDKLSVKSNKTRLSLRRSGERSRDNTNEEETTSHFGETSRPQSKQSFHEDDSRPESRVSYKSMGKSGAKKFRLSTGRRSSTPNEVTVNNSNSTPQKEEEQEKIKLGCDSPVRVCNNVVRNKLSLKRSSSGSSKTADRDNKTSTIMPIKKMGKLHKIRSRIKFIRLGSTRSRDERRELVIKTCNAITQTSPSHFRDFSSESMRRIIIPETRTASAASIDSRQVKEAQAACSSSETGRLHESTEEFDTVNKVNMLSPEKDSQLKFLATKSPSIPRMTSVDSGRLVRNVGNSCSDMRESSFTNSSVIPEEYAKAVKKCGEKLIVTDSEDQDTPDISFRKIKRRNNHETEKVLSTTTSKTTSNLSDCRMDDKIAAVASCSVMNHDKSPSLHSVGNNSGGNSSRASLRRKRNLKDSLGSPAKRRDTDKLKSPTKTSPNYPEMEVDTDAETVLIEKGKGDQHLEDSEASGITAKHKVVRKLKYSQESGSNSHTRSGNRESAELQTAANKEKKMNRSPEKKTIQRVQRISSTDSDELLEISLATKQSSSNSQTIQRAGPSREVNRSPLLSEDLTVVFSSNKDTQESKRKRSPSPTVLDDRDLKVIAANWCAELGPSSEEIVLDNEKVLGSVKCLSSHGVPPKKPRVEVQDSPASLDSDNFPVLSPTAIYGKKKKVVEETTAKINDQGLSNDESTLIDDLDKVAAQFDGIDAQSRSEKSGANSIPPSNTRHVNLAGNVECSMKRGSTFSGVVTTNRSSTPIKSKSLEDGDLSAIHRNSRNSDKENELDSQGAKKKELLSNTRQKVVSNEDSHELQVNFTSEKFEADYPLKLDARSVPSKAQSTNNTELFESSFDRDCLNITQEQMLMQEVEDNLLGRNSKNTTKTNSQEPSAANKSPMKNGEKNLARKESATSSNDNQKAKGYQIARIDIDDPDTLDDDIIESTPEKNLPVRKDLHPQSIYSQRSNASQKSFMSGDMTPISKTVPKHHQTMSQASMLSEPISKSSSFNRNVSRKLSSHGPLNHSTPKVATSAMRRSNMQLKSGSVNKDRKLCFVCSYLTLSEVQIVKAFARKHNVEYTATYKPEVTHVIVETNDRDSAGRTLKYLLGVAHKKWIVSFRWVTDSMSQNKILDESDYEAVDSDTEEPGPRRSRLSDKGLFEEFAFVCMKPFSDITIEQLKDLLLSTGGTVIETLEGLASVKNKYKLILYNSDIHEPGVLENWRRRGRALPMQVEWVLSCISQYDLVSFRYYLQPADIELLQLFDFPAKLTAEEEDSCSGDERST